MASVSNPWFMGSTLLAAAGAPGPWEPPPTALRRLLGGPPCSAALRRLLGALPADQREQERVGERQGRSDHESRDQQHDPDNGHLFPPSTSQGSVTGSRRRLR